MFLWTTVSLSTSLDWALPGVMAGRQLQEAICISHLQICSYRLFLPKFLRKSMLWNRQSHHNEASADVFSYLAVAGSWCLVWGLALGLVAAVSSNAFETIYCCPVSDSILSHSLLLVFVHLGPNIKSSRINSCSILTESSSLLETSDLALNSPSCLHCLFQINRSRLVFPIQIILSCMHSRIESIEWSSWSRFLLSIMESGPFHILENRQIFIECM